MHQSDKMKTVIAFLETRNKEIGDGSGKVDTNKFLSTLISYGCGSEDDLKQLSWEDLLNILEVCWIEPKPLVKPKMLAGKIASIFRDKTEEISDKKRPSSKKVEKMTPRELVSCFDPEEPDSPVALRLKTITKGEPFVVFSKGRLIEEEATYNLLMEVKQGYSGRKTIEINGEIKPVFIIGNLPDNYVDENPIYIGRPLLSDFCCDQTNRSWAGIDLSVRQFIRIAVEMKVFKTDIESVHHIIDMAIQQNAFNTLCKRYQNVAIVFDERKKLNTLPRLQIALKTSKGGQTQRPFDGGKQVQWVDTLRQAGYYHGTLSNHIAKNL